MKSYNQLKNAFSGAQADLQKIPDFAPRVGSLCSGYGGIELALDTLMQAELVFTADIGSGARKVLKQHFPDVPNLGDLTKIDWDAVEPVDIITAGFPCQDVSQAGGRSGLRANNRSGVWYQVARAVDALRPQLVIVENVRGLLSADADSDVESCPWCLGESGHERPLRACGAVLGDLADLGFDAEWRLVSAADAGAPHRRDRVFILAWSAADTAPADAWGRRRPGREGPAERHEPGHYGAAEDADGAAGGERWVAASGQATGGRPRADAGRSAGERAAADPGGVGLEGLGEDAGPAADGAGREVGPESRGHGPAGSGDDAADAGWGPYGAAIRRWETVTGRPAPRPVEPTGRDGGMQLSVRFVEFMMGLPDGWVTAVPGMSRTEMLTVLGNGVVPQQCALALEMLLPVYYASREVCDPSRLVV